MANATEKPGGQVARTRLLLIDDEAQYWAGMFDQGLRPLGFDLAIEADPTRATAVISSVNPDVILLDLHFPGDDLAMEGSTTGGKLLVDIRTGFPDIPVVVFTTLLADGDIALEAFASQPHGMFSKHQIKERQDAGEAWAPILAKALTDALEVARWKNRPDSADMGFVVGATDAMRHVVALIRNCARHAGTVLIYGETGTGKRGVAEAIHRLSGRAGAFEQLNCSGIHEDTLTDLLFGHVKGAFSGAAGDRAGLFEQAAGGTLFLDEIQAMPMSLQNHLMTVVEDKRIRRMGSNRDVIVDTRLIVATNQLPAALVEDGILREDLAYQLNDFPIALPPLRERKEDLPELFSFLVRRAAAGLKSNVTDLLRPELLAVLAAYDWPGNIRELDSVLKRAIAATTSNVLLPGDITIIPLGATRSQAGAGGHPLVPGQSLAAGTGGKAAEIANEIDGLPVAQRYAYLTANVLGDLRRDVLIELVCRIRAGRTGKVTHKVLANYLDEVEGLSDYDRIRQMVTSAGVHLTQVPCNQ